MSPRLCFFAGALSVVASACATVPPAPPAPVGPTFEEKIAWVLRLEDQRVLHDPAPAVPPAPPEPARGRQKGPVAVIPPPPVPDLVRLLTDSEARVRRRAALAVGRVGLRDGERPLIALLADTDPEVRQMAAFALGLIGDRAARDPLVNALADPSRLVQGSAAEALGLIGDPSAADAIGRLIGGLAGSSPLAPQIGGGGESIENDPRDARRDTAEAAFRLGVCALVRLKAYDQLAAAVLDQQGEPRVKSWPVAFALQRLERPASLKALLTLAKESHPYTRAFAVKGLGALHDSAAVPMLLSLLSSGDRNVLIETIRALGRIGDPAAAGPLLRMVRGSDTAPSVRIEAVSALGGLQRPSVSGLMDTILDLMGDPSPPVRVAALKSTARLDPEGFVAVLSGLDPDPHWSVRAALASVLGTLTPDVGLPRLTMMLGDSDQRVIPSVLAALVKLNAPNVVTVLMERLKAEDPVVRVAAANGIGELQPPGGPQALGDAYVFGQRDPTYIARGAALGALSKYGAAVATPLLRTALADKDWAVRVRAVSLLKSLDPSADPDAEIRPAPTTLPPERYQAPGLVTPPVSTHVYIDTDRGTVELELAVLDAPLTVENFVTLARKGFFNGLNIHRVVPDFVIQDGDPRGDGEGGPGYTIRDELNELPYLRGTVGMALDWADTGGSQFFITHSPQPHLDAKYTVFGRVVAGMEVVDQIQLWDVIRRVRVWDGEHMIGAARIEKGGDGRPPF